MTSHSVGGSSPTGAKLSERTCLGSTDDRSGGSIKLLIISSNKLKIVVGNDISVGFLAGEDDWVNDDDDGFCFLKYGGMVVVVVIGLLGVVGFGFSSILTAEMVNGGGGECLDKVGGERMGFR